MTKKIQISLFSLIFALFLAFFAVSCDADGGSGGGGGNSDPQIPAALHGTRWNHTQGDKIAFTATTATTTPVSGGEQTFTFKNNSYVADADLNTLYFGSSQTADYVVYREGGITSVNLGGISRGLGWSIDESGDEGDGGAVLNYTFDTALLGDWENDDKTYMVRIIAYNPFEQAGFDPVTGYDGVGNKITDYAQMSTDIKVTAYSDIDGTVLRQSYDSQYTHFTTNNNIMTRTVYISGIHTRHFYRYELTDSGNTLILSEGGIFGTDPVNGIPATYYYDDVTLKKTTFGYNWPSYPNEYPPR